MRSVIGGLVAPAPRSHPNTSTAREGTEEAELLHLPALATIPNFAIARRSAYGNPLTIENGASPHAGVPHQVVVAYEPRSVIAEAFRTLRTSVLFSTPGAAPKVILVTSATASEGKTLNCLNLAAAFAESGSRVLLLDVDLRHPSCHRALGVENTAALCYPRAPRRKLTGGRCPACYRWSTPPNPRGLWQR
jgi:hypothetical protein